MGVRSIACSRQAATVGACIAAVAFIWYRSRRSIRSRLSAQAGAAGAAEVASSNKRRSRRSREAARGLRACADQPSCAVRTNADGCLEGFCSGIEGVGVSRRVYCADAVQWLEALPLLPPSWAVVTSLPDVCEVQPPLPPAEYELWFVSTVQLILSKLAPHQIAVFYQTDGRNSGIDSSWLDKAALCHSGAKAAGARCVWHRLVLSATPGRPQTGRPGFVHLIAFSAEHRLQHGAPLVDVLLDRGHMSWPRAMGSAACEAAIEYLCEHAGRETRHAGQRKSPPDTGPPLIFDPFCGCGSVLAAANAKHLEAVGIELSRKRCRVAARYLGPPGSTHQQPVEI